MRPPPKATSAHVLANLKARGLAESAAEHAALYGVTLDEMLGATKRRAATLARHTYWVWLRANYEYSYPELGRIFARHHQTVLMGVRHAEAL